MHKILTILIFILLLSFSFILIFLNGNRYPTNESLLGASRVISAVLSPAPFLNLTFVPSSASLPTPAISPSFSSLPHSLVDSESQDSYFVPILNYHYIRDYPEVESLGYALSISPKEFEKQMSYLVKNNFQTISLSDLYEALLGQKNLPEKPVILTFDDGYKDFYTTAYPILKRYKLKATIYVIVDKIGDKEGRYLSRDELKKLDGSNLIEIGSHSLSHRDLTTLDNFTLYKEVVFSKLFLEDFLGHEVKHFCYPSGKYNQKVIAMVESANYTTATTTKIGAIHRKGEFYTLSRIRINGGLSLESFAKKLSPSFYGKKKLN